MVKLKTAPGAYYRLDGSRTTGDDPLRTIWDGMCTYWTDDWSQVETARDGTPLCSDCGCPGYQVTMEEFERSTAAFEAEGNPGYVEFVLGFKGTCKGRDGELGKLWAERQAKVQQDAKNRIN